jgi:anaerobic selenocysteine-containing dehydrogenase
MAKIQTNTGGEMRTVIKSVCQMCGTTYGGCGIDVHVEDGKIVKIEGTKGHPVNDGRLCAKGLAAIQLEYDPNRLRYPMKRTGERGEGKWQRISWDEAMGIIVTRLKEIIKTDGARAISWAKGQGAGWEDNFHYAQRFMNAIGSPNLATFGNVCHISRVISHVFTYGGMPDPDIENTKLMLLWGANPMNTAMGNHGVRIMKAKQRGAKLIVIDPRFSKTAAKADVWVQPRPGTDGALALGMLNVIIEENLYDREFVEKWTYGFDKLSELVKKYPPERVEEITWVPANTLREVARIFATIKPSVLYEGNGIDQQPSVVQTTRALSILRTITGELDVPGGMVLDPAPITFPPRPITMRDISEEAMNKAFEESVSKHPLYFGIFYVTIPELEDAILTDKPYPIKATIAQSINWALASSNTTRVREALKKVPFLVVFDLFMNATAEFADIVLPAASFLERTNLLYYFGISKPRLDASYRQLQRKVVEPLGECKSDYDFISGLARRLGHEKEFPWRNVEAAIDYELEPEGITYKELEDHPEDIVKRRYFPEEVYQKYEKNFAKPPTPTHKAELYSTVFERVGYDPLPIYKEPEESPISRADLLKKYPLICMAGLKPGLYTHTQYRTLPWLREIMPDPWIDINTQKAKELGIEDGDMVIVKSLRGSIEIKCKVTNAIDPRVVMITHGWGDPYAGSYPITNILTPHEIRSPESDGIPNRCFLVSVAKKA